MLQSPPIQNGFTIPDTLGNKLGTVEFEKRSKLTVRELIFFEVPQENTKSHDPPQTLAGICIAEAELIG